MAIVLFFFFLSSKLCKCNQSQFSSVAQLYLTLCDPMDFSAPDSLSITNSQRLLKLIPSNQLILCHSLLLLISIFPSIRVISYKSVLHIRWLKYWSLSFRISLSNEYSELIPFRMNCSDLLAVQRTLKSLLPHNSLKASVLWRPALTSIYDY